MKNHCTFLLLFFFSLTGMAQTLNLEKASPFTAVKWSDKDQPIVKFNDAWFTLVQLDQYTVPELLEFCKKEFDDKWKKRFSEDLVEVLTKMGTPPNELVELILLKDSIEIKTKGTFTLENRQKVLKYNQEHGKMKKVLQKTSKSGAIEDIDQFGHILEEQSSYIHLTDYDYKIDLGALKANICKMLMDSVGIDYLTFELAKIMAKIGDRHSSVRNEGFQSKDHPTYSLQLPFSIASLKGKVVALQPLTKDRTYAHYQRDFPFIKSINGLPIEVFIDSMAYTSRKAPKEAKLARGITEIQRLGSLYLKNNLRLPAKIEIVFTNGKAEKKQTVSLVNKRLDWISEIEYNKTRHISAIEKGDFHSLSKVLKGNIGYISLPKMFHFDEENGLEAAIDSIFTEFQHTRALIIDLRYNPGGSRDLLLQFSKYMIPKRYSPWVANVAYLRTDKKEGVHDTMSGRFLYPINSNHFDESDRRAIKEFSQGFTTAKIFNLEKFSEPHYMVLKNGKTPYDRPIFILVNEYSFSAASVFTSTFKGLPNIKIAGVTTDGSSGNSKRMYLDNSNIRIRISTMLSFQRNGKTLDGNGTVPDLYIPKDAEQILHGNDTQLQQLVGQIDQIQNYERER